MPKSSPYSLPPSVANALDRIRLGDWEEADLQAVVAPWYVLILVMDRLSWLYTTLENYPKRTNRRYISPEDRMEFLEIFDFVRKAINQ